MNTLSQAYWESRVESLKVVRFQAQQIRDALFELVETNDDPKIKSEVECLATYELENFELLLGMTIWYDILFAVNSVSKNLQSKDMCINMVIEQLKGLLSFFETYRENRFENAFFFQKNCFVKKEPVINKKQFDENIENEDIKSPQELFRIDYFLYIVDKAITTLQNRFEQFKIYEDIFCFLFSIKNLKLLDCVLLKEKCLNLEKYLKHDNLLDLNGLDLFSELNILKGDYRIEK